MGVGLSVWVLAAASVPLAKRLSFLQCQGERAPRRWRDTRTWASYQQRLHEFGPFMCRA